MRLDNRQSAGRPVNKLPLVVALEGQTTRVLFNLEALEYLSSAGLRVLLSAAKEMRRREGKIVLCSLNEFVKEIFEVSGFQSLIPIAESVESGVEVLS